MEKNKKDINQVTLIFTFHSPVLSINDLFKIFIIVTDTSNYSANEKSTYNHN